MEEEVKVCEYCETVNKVDSLECLNCGADLTLVIAEKREIILTDALVNNGTTTGDIEIDRTSSIENNSPDENKGEGISKVSIIEDEGKNSSETVTTVPTVKFLTMKLVNSQDNKVIEIPIEGGLVGREGDICPEYFKTNPYLSCLHAKVYYRDTDLIVLDEGSTNGTKLNGIMIEKGVETKLCLGDKVSFANLEFKVSL